MKALALLAVVAFWAAAIGLPLVPAVSTVVIDVNDNAPNFFSPDVTRVHVGDSVVFSLSHNHHTGAAHTVTSVAGPTQSIPALSTGRTNGLRRSPANTRTSAPFTRT
ncbi:MAG TPA: hypothetical protein VGL99_00860 [Chloroflexota bacterium]